MTRNKTFDGGKDVEILLYPLSSYSFIILDTFTT